MAEINKIADLARSVLVGISAGILVLVLTFAGVLFLIGRDNVAWKKIWDAFKGAITIGIAPALAGIFLYIAGLRK